MKPIDETFYILGIKVRFYKYLGYMPLHEYKHGLSDISMLRFPSICIKTYPSGAEALSRNYFPEEYSNTITEAGKVSEITPVSLKKFVENKDSIQPIIRWMNHPTFFVEDIYVERAVRAVITTAFNPIISKPFSNEN